MSTYLVDDNTNMLMSFFGVNHKNRIDRVTKFHKDITRRDHWYSLSSKIVGKKYGLLIEHNRTWFHAGQDHAKVRTLHDPAQSDPSSVTRLEYRTEDERDKFFDSLNDKLAEQKCTCKCTCGKK